MLLRESGEQANQAYNVDAVTQSDGDAGVPHGDYLRRLVEATIRGEWISLAQLRGDAEAAGVGIDGDAEGVVVGKADAVNTGAGRDGLSKVVHVERVGRRRLKVIAHAACNPGGLIAGARRHIARCGARRGPCRGGVHRKSQSA